MDKIIVYTNPVEPFQRVVVIKDKEVITNIGVMPNNLTEIVFDASQKYDVKNICFIGVKTFALGFMQEMKTTYDTLNIEFMEE